MFFRPVAADGEALSLVPSVCVVTGIKAHTQSSPTGVTSFTSLFGFSNVRRRREARWAGSGVR